MKGNDKEGLTWEQQVEYSRVKALGRDLNLMFRERTNKLKRDALVTYHVDPTAQEVLDEIE